LANKYRPNFILIEDAANGTPLRQSLQDKIQLGPIVGVRPDIAKEARVARHTYTLETNPLYLPRYAAWLDDFRAEFLSFPQTRHDDQVDALAQFYYWYDEYQKRVPFSFDMGFTCHNGSAHVARLAAPSPGEMLDFLQRSGLGPAR
jgi:phage terminase large subunit-like protein